MANVTPWLTTLTTSLNKGQLGHFILVPIDS